MPPHKKAYLERIRKESSYPWFRKFISLIAIVFIGLGAGISLLGVIGGFSMGRNSGIIGFGTVLIPVLAGLLFVAVGAILKEASIMVADIADSITDLNCRYEL